MAYEMLAGRRPFDAENPLDAITQRLTQVRRRWLRQRPAWMTISQTRS